MSSANRRMGRRAFTLIELLVVITLIVLLAGILLPTLTKVNNQAKRTASQTQLESISKACETYFIAFAAYPGYFSEAQMDNDNISERYLTPNENLLLSLLGGVLPKTEVDAQDRYDVSASSFDTRLTINKKYGDGPVINPLTPGQRRKQGAFYNPKPQELKIVTGGYHDGLNKNGLAEVVDPIKNQPILYYRAMTNDMKPAAYKAVLGTGRHIATYGVQHNVHYTNANKTTGTMYEGANNRLQSEYSLLADDGPGGKGAVFYNLAWLVVNRELSPINPTQAKSHNDPEMIARGAFFLMATGPDGVYMNKEQNGGKQEEIKTLPEYEKFAAKNDDVMVFGGTR